MIRLLGAITGSALAIATLLVVVGVPQFKAPPNDDDTQQSVMTLPIKPETPAEPQPPSPEVLDATEAQPAAETTANEPAPLDPQTLDVEELPQPSTDDDMHEATGKEAAVAAADDETDQPLLGADQWYAFWSPFRSEIAAEGFVAQLQRVTGLDYRVVKVKPGRYEVAFSYTDDADLQAHLSQISAATGLELPES